MPFDQNKTQHIFEQRADGGIETVKVLDRSDQSQLALVRSHLQMEATKFSAGDFGDPASIHGTSMPGLGALSVAGSRLKIAYAELPDGGTIVYSTDDPVVASAIHDWFNAQTSDHGGHATAH